MVIGVALSDDVRVGCQKSGSFFYSSYVWRQLFGFVSCCLFVSNFVPHAAPSMWWEAKRGSATKRGVADIEGADKAGEGRHSGGRETNSLSGHKRQRESDKQAGRQVC